MKSSRFSIVKERVQLSESNKFLPENKTTQDTLVGAISASLNFISKDEGVFKEMGYSVGATDGETDSVEHLADTLSQARRPCQEVYIASVSQFLSGAIGSCIYKQTSPCAILCKSQRLGLAKPPGHISAIGARRHDVRGTHVAGQRPS